MLGIIRRSSTLGSDVGASPKLGNEERHRLAHDPTSTRRKSSLGRSAQQLQSRLSSMKLGKGKGVQADPEEPPSGPFGDLFLSLPAEIQLQIILYLDLPDVLSCRLICSATNRLFLANQWEIAKRCVLYKLPPYCERLYSCRNISGKYNLQHLYSLIHRYHVARNLASQVTNFIVNEFVRRNGYLRQSHSAQDQKRLERKLLPLLFTLGHFFETWREVMLNNYGTSGWNTTEEEMTDISRRIMDMYDLESLMDVDCMHHLLLATFSRLLRPPTYATSFERSLRGWSGRRPSTEALIATMTVGGTEKIRQILSHKSYSSRCKAVESFLRGINAKESVKWKDNWNYLLYGGPFASTTDSNLNPPGNVLVMDFTSIWDPIASDLLVERGVISDVSELKTTRAFISDILGYDIVYGTRLRTVSDDTDEGDENFVNEDNGNNVSDQEENLEEQEWLML